MNNIKQIEVKTEFGQCCLLIYLDDVSRGYLTNVEIFKEHRRQEHGNELLETALRIAKQQGVSCVVLQVVSNSFVRRWYENKGFRRLNVYQHSPQEGHIWMTKEI
jgi:ribosomal protein S18 acetylase RimI-like enzyme